MTFVVYLKDIIWYTVNSHRWRSKWNLESSWNCWIAYRMSTQNWTLFKSSFLKNLKTTLLYALMKITHCLIVILWYFFAIQQSFWRYWIINEIYTNPDNKTFYFIQIGIMDTTAFKYSNIFTGTYLHIICFKTYVSNSICYIWFVLRYS